MLETTRPHTPPLARWVLLGSLATLSSAALNGCGGAIADETDRGVAARSDSEADQPESEESDGDRAQSAGVPQGHSPAVGEHTSGDEQDVDSAALNPVSEDRSVSGSSAVQTESGQGNRAENPDAESGADASDPAHDENSGMAEAQPEPCVSLPPAAESEIARRLERLFWNSDQGELIQLLDAGELSLGTPEATRKQASAMLGDERARTGLSAFVKSWLMLQDLQNVDFEEPLLGSAQESLDRTIDALTWGSDGAKPAGVSSLFTGERAVVDAELAGFYEITAPTSEWELVGLPEPHSLGLLTQALWLNANPNPSWRGSALRSSLTCSPIPRPPVGTAPVRDVANGLTTREAYQQHMSDPACAGCHGLIDPIGFGFEDFDSSGKYRTEELGMPIDASGAFTELGLSFDGTEGLRELLTGELGQTVETCLVESAVRYSVFQPQSNSAPIVPRFTPGCVDRSNGGPEQGLDATLQQWLLATAASDAFAAEYK